jgi:alkaline phosphatase
LVTESAIAATTLASGVKTCGSRCLMDCDNRPLKSVLLESAKQKGMKTGIIVTSSITHGTPVSFLIS